MRILSPLRRSAVLSSLGLIGDFARWAPTCTFYKSLPATHGLRTIRATAILLIKLDHLLGAVAFSTSTYALREVSAKIAAVGDRVAREEREKFGNEVPEQATRPSHIVDPGTENLESIPTEFIHLQHAETQDALMIAFPAHGIASFWLERVPRELPTAVASDA